MLENAAWVLGTCIPLLRGGAQSLDDGTQAPRIPEYLCREVTTKAREFHRVSAHAGKRGSGARYLYPSPKRRRTELG